MKINLTGDVKEVLTGVENLISNYNFKGIAENSSIDVSVKKISNEAKPILKISTCNGYSIEYSHANCFFRALAILIENMHTVNFKKKETAIFESCSNMIDLSRNAVYTVEEMKKMLCYLALTGHNKVFLFFEGS